MVAVILFVFPSIVWLFYNSFLFVIFMALFVVFSFSSISWGGGILFFESYNDVLLVLMSLYLVEFVLLVESDKVLRILGKLTMFFSIGFFAPSGLLMLYMFYELTMVPVLIIIMVFGVQIEKIRSGYYLFLYAVFFSLPYLYVWVRLGKHMLTSCFDVIVSLESMVLLTIVFMVKFPVYFLHLWLPKAHVEAPTAASMILSGLLLNLGSMGFMRLIKSLSYFSVDYWMLLSICGMIMSSLICVFQSDAKSLVAYSSVAHMSFVLIMLLYMVNLSKSISVVMMLAHGFTSTCMFYLVGVFYHYSGSRIVYFMNSFMNSSVLISIVLIGVIMSNMGVPFSLSFFSEFTGVVVFFNLFKLGIVFMLFYCFLTFYYSVYFMVNVLMGKSFMDLGIVSFGSAVPVILLMFNVFWLGVFF